MMMSSPEMPKDKPDIGFVKENEGNKLEFDKPFTIERHRDGGEVEITSSEDFKSGPIVIPALSGDEEYIIKDQQGNELWRGQRVVELIKLNLYKPYSIEVVENGAVVETVPSEQFASGPMVLPALSGSKEYVFKDAQGNEVWKGQSFTGQELSIDQQKKVMEEKLKEQIRAIDEKEAGN